MFDQLIRNVCLSELTFIILDRSKLDDCGEEIPAMVGDTNLFLSHDPDDGRLVGEIEIMIAEPSARGKGLGWESTLIMLKYGMEQLKIKSFVAKIGLDNPISITMFEKKLLFKEESRSTVFDEITLRRNCDAAEWTAMIDRELESNHLQIETLT